MGRVWRVGCDVICNAIITGSGLTTGFGRNTPAVMFLLQSLLSRVCTLLGLWIVLGNAMMPLTRTDPQNGRPIHLQTSSAHFCAMSVRAAGSEPRAARPRS